MIKNMLFFLYGEDNFRSKRKLQEIIEQYKKIHENGLNLIVIDCPSADFEDFKNEVETASMFKEKKLIVLKNVFLSPQFESSLLNFKGNLERNEKDTIVFWQEGDIDNRKLFSKFLEENAKVQKFDLLAGSKLKIWAKKEIKKLGAKIQEEALEELLIATGSNLWQLSNEIQKLAAYKLNLVRNSEFLNGVKEKNTEIALEDVKKMVNSELETDIFQTIDEIAIKNKKRALEFLHKFLEEGESPGYLLSMISYQFRNLIVVKNLLEKGVPYYSLFKKTGFHPFVLRKSYGLSQKFSLLELKKIFQKIFQTDVDIKIGKIEPETALDLLIAET